MKRVFLLLAILCLGSLVAAIDVSFPPGSLKISEQTNIVNYTVTVISNPTENFNIYFTVVPSNYEALQYTTVTDAQEYLLTPGSEKKISILLTMAYPPRNYNAFYRIIARKASSGNNDGMVGALVAPAFNVQVDYVGNQPTAIPTEMPTITPTPIATPTPFDDSNLIIPTPAAFNIGVRAPAEPSLIAFTTPTPTASVSNDVVVNPLPVRQPNPIAHTKEELPLIPEDPKKTGAVLLLLVSAGIYISRDNIIKQKLLPQSQGEENAKI